MTLKRILAVPLGAALLLVCFAGTASADRLVDYHFNHIDGATVAAKLWQKFDGDKGLYVDLKLRNTRRGPGCINGAVRWSRRGRDREDFFTSSPRRTQAIRACAKKRWVGVGRTPVRRVADFSGVWTHVAVEGGKGQWKDLIDWNRRSVKRKADRIMNMSYRSFIRYKRAAIRNRHHGGAREDHTWPLDWADDGCSIPLQERFDGIKFWSRFFNRPCQQHDFGYRNYGKQYLALHRTDDARERIDDKLRAEMTRVCRDRRGQPKCYRKAGLIYLGVRAGGSGAFYGQE